jgi:hypothetical protein
MASVLDFTLLLPTCICIPKHLKCCMRMGASSSSSLWLSVMKMLSSTKNTLLSSKVVPLDVVGCPSSLPFSAFVLPFLGGLKNRNLDGLVSSLTVSRKAYMMYVKRTSEALCIFYMYFSTFKFTTNTTVFVHFLYYLDYCVPYSIFFNISKSNGCWMVSNAFTRSMNRA